MPRHSKKKLRKIIDNLDEFSEILINWIADESDEGSKKLIASIEKAKIRYAKPIESWLTGWIYQFTRLRGDEIQSAIKGIEEYPDAYTRIQEFKLLISKGEWEHGSFNHYLFDELIKSIPGYEPLDIDTVHLVILRLKELLNNKMDEFMSQYVSNQKLIEDREREKAKIHSHEKDVSKLFVFNDLSEAKKVNQVQNNDRVFCLEQKNKLWKVTWIDLQGKSYVLEPTEELVTILRENNVMDLKQVSPLNLKRIKNECLKVRENFLNKIVLLINPVDSKTKAEESDSALCAKGITSTFVLRGKPNNYTVSWINSLGIPNQVLLNLYPSLQAFLVGKTQFVKEDDLLDLKSHLLQVNTKKSLTMDDFKDELSRCLTHTNKKPKATEAQTSHKLDLEKYEAINKCLGARVVDQGPRNKLDLGKFKAIEECLASKIQQGNELTEFQRQQSVPSEPIKVVNIQPNRPAPQKINLDNYANLTLFFGARSNSTQSEVPLQECITHEL
ncbi:hypothetical protein [Legionella waltersii]|uniref:Uncharacterized protein n=1 Tax=Legionella waltersii TaxID=66969 RepID=A0A0W1A0Z1_9GAMM|nr:hypothetical protein [Legionella waltersii]KTD74800.1 hypothetical protein Lwal_2841 [Legionella waltersii]SNV00828.1 Uncharacterised protein [Legionella waltersii]